MRAAILSRLAGDLIGVLAASLALAAAALVVTGLIYGWCWCLTRVAGDGSETGREQP